MASRFKRVRIKEKKQRLKDGRVVKKWLAYHPSRKPGQKFEYRTFFRKKDAEDFKAGVERGLHDGTYVSSRDSITVDLAAKEWLASPHIQGLERSTYVTYEQHLENHINPFFFGVILSDIDGRMVSEFQEWLQRMPHSRLAEKDRPVPKKVSCSAVMTKKVMTTLSSLLGYACSRMWVGRNVVKEFRGRDRSLKAQRRKLEVCRDIPTIEEIRSIIEHAEGRWRPFLLTAIFTGLRASELRGLRWRDVDLDGRVLHVRQRADRFNKIGPPKSEAGTRSIPLMPLLVNTLREWRLQCPRCDPATLAEAGDNLVFPSRHGGVESHTICLRDGFGSVQRAAGLVIDTGRLDKQGQPITMPKYGLHALRHWFASWCLNRVEDGGLGLEGHHIQKRLGHSKISMTIDVYGHLFPSKGDDGALAAAEKRLLG